MTFSRIEERLVALLPALHLDQLGRKHAEERQRFLCRLILKAAQDQSPHRAKPQASSFSRDYLRIGLRCRHGNTYISLLEPFFEFPRGRTGYSPRRGLSKWYRLKPEVHEVAQQLVEEPSTHIEKREKDSPRLRLRDNGSCPLPLPALLPEITLEHVERAFLSLDEKDSEAREELERIKKAVELHGGLPNEFHGEQINGRLRFTGSVHPVSIKRRVRKALFNGTGCWDYDLRSCHLSIFLSLGDSLGFSTAHTAQYLRAKIRFHSEWQICTRLNQRDCFKELVLGFLTGGRLSKSLKERPGQLLGLEAAEKWCGLPSVERLHAEIQSGMKQVVAARRGDGGTFMNAIGASIQTSKWGEAASFLLTGFEQWAIREICKKLPAGSLRTVIYDGWVTSEQLSAEAIAELEDHLARQSKKELGVELRLSIKGTAF